MRNEAIMKQNKRMPIDSYEKKYIRDIIIDGKLPG